MLDFIEKPQLHKIQNKSRVNFQSPILHKNDDTKEDSSTTCSGMQRKIFLAHTHVTSHAARVLLNIAAYIYYCYFMRMSQLKGETLLQRV